MKFLMTYHPDSKAPPTPEQMKALGELTVEMLQSGKVLLTGGLQRPSPTTRVRYAKGKLSVTDGPFAETKELIDGFALMHVASREEALELAVRFMNVAGEGECEMQQVFEGADIPKR